MHEVIHPEGWAPAKGYANGMKAPGGQVFVGEIPANFYGWLQKPRVLRKGPTRRRGRKKTYPRRTKNPPACEVQNLVRYSPVFHKQRWQRYRIKDTELGPEVW